MQRYFANIVDKHALLTDDDAFHLLHVMRAKKGTEVEIVNEGIVYIGKVIGTKPLLIEIIEKTKENNELSVDLVLIMSILKGEKLDFVIQKATEIGVSEIILLRSERCIGKIREYETEKKLKRFSKIAKEACEQSKRSIIPVITKVIDFKQISLLKADYKFIGSVSNNDVTAKDFLKSVKAIEKHSKVMIMVGPEGGFSEKEELLAFKNGFKPISLGRRVLRAETASIASLSVLATLLDSK